jgi:choline dehydrogenase-like flavoprotein
VVCELDQPCQALAFTCVSPNPILAAEEKITTEPYDYIICGGGTAGCVLAERLSADGTKRVLVLEAGRSDFENLFIRIPAGVLRLFRSVYDWQHESSGEKACNGRNIFLQRGKVSMSTDNNVQR